MTGACGPRKKGGYAPSEQQRRERLRLEAARRFARGGTISEIARELRVTEGQRIVSRTDKGGGPGARAETRRSGRRGRCRGSG
jgi:hypothetical protein